MPGGGPGDVLVPAVMPAGTGAEVGSGPRARFPAGPWRLPSGPLSLDRPRIMGILNLTPDSFSDGGQLSGVEDALARARAMVAAGADLIDVGGESTRPGARLVSEAEEAARILPFLEEAVGALGVPLSVDTRKAGVARAALDAGAAVVNDVSGLRHDPHLAPLVAERGAALVLMHMRGDPGSMAERAIYGDLALEITRELQESLHHALAAGVREDAIVVDPGFGFAKTTDQSLELLGRLGELGALGCPVLVGPSRKSFLGKIVGVPPAQRGAATAAACVLAYIRGARIFRVHDVEPVAQALAVAHALTERAEQSPGPQAAQQARSESGR